MRARSPHFELISSTAIAALGLPPTLTSSTFRVRVKSRDARLARSSVFRKLPREATCHRWRVTLRLELQFLPISYGPVRIVWDCLGLSLVEIALQFRN
jgi:hypothetical protein